MAPQRPSPGQAKPAQKKRSFRPWQLLTRLIHQQTLLLLTLLFIAGVGALIGTLLSMARLSTNLMETQAIESATGHAQRNGLPQSTTRPQLQNPH